MRTSSPGNKPMIRPQRLNRSLRLGDHVFAIYPLSITRGTIVEGGAYGQPGQLGFRSDDRPHGWIMPIDAISGQCTYSTHNHVVIAAIDDEAVAARFEVLDRHERAEQRRKQISKLSDEQVLALNWPDAA